MRIALLQLNPTVGDFEVNATRLVDGLRQAEREGADLVVSSELGAIGYPPRDLLEQPSFVERASSWARWIVNQSSEVPLVFGSLGERSGRLSNDAVVAHRGRELSRSSKVLLPNYDVFDEQRHFEAGPGLGRFEHRGLRCAVSICEDAWARAAGLQQRYAEDPLDAVRSDDTDLLINLSASPFTLTKYRWRQELFSGIAKARGVMVVMVNQVGGNDELLFDGQSALFDARGELLARAAAFREDLLVADLDTAGRIEPEPSSDEAAATDALVMGIRDYAAKCGFQRAVLGLSGGVDSALVATLATEALGADRVLGVAMPTRYSSDHSVNDARELAENLGMPFELIDVDPMFQSHLERLAPTLNRLASPGERDVTWENVQARIRGATVMAISNRTGALALTTGNKSEIAVGYCTLYGDMVGGLAVISDVPKTMVYRLARWANRERHRIPVSTLTKAPSAELRPNQTDQDSLPPYDLLDAILEAHVEQHLGADQLLGRGFDPAVVNRVLHLVRTAEYKRRQAAPGLILTRKAFGSGRRVPIAQRYVDTPRNNSGA